MEPQEKVNRKGGRTSLVVQWLRIHASTAGRMCSTPGQETKIHIPSSVAKKKKEKRKRKKKEGGGILYKHVVGRTENFKENVRDTEETPENHMKNQLASTAHHVVQE